MKIISDYKIFFPSKAKCRMCGIVDYVVENQYINHKNCINCPICNYIINDDVFNDEEQEIINEYFVKNKSGHGNDTFEFCPKCNIIFQYEDICWLNNEHCVEEWEHGDIIYSALFVNYFEYKGKEYSGMIVFDNKDEFINLLKNNEFLPIDFEVTNENTKSMFHPFM